MTDPRRPSINLFGLDATDVDRFLKGVVDTLRPIAAQAADHLASTIIDVAVEEGKKYTPDEVDVYLESVKQAAKEKVRKALGTG